jgi:hypothetical protein
LICWRTSHGAVQFVRKRRLVPSLLDLVILSSLSGRTLDLHNLTFQLGCRHQLMYLTPWTTITAYNANDTAKTHSHSLHLRSQPASDETTHHTDLLPENHIQTHRLTRHALDSSDPPFPTPSPLSTSQIPSSTLPSPRVKKDSHLSPRLPPQPIHMPVKQQRREQRPAQQDEVARNKAVLFVSCSPIVFFLRIFESSSSLV